MELDKKHIIERFHNTLEEISNQVLKNSNVISIDSIINITDSILEILENKNRVFLYGAGRSGFIARAFAQRLMHLGIKSCFISDAVTYRYTEDDLLIIISGSGGTTSSLAITQKAKEIGGKIVLFTTNPESSIGHISDLVVAIKGKSKDKATSEISLAPYTSLFDISTLSVLDAIGGVLMDILNISENDIDKTHASIE